MKNYLLYLLISSFAFILISCQTGNDAMDMQKKDLAYKAMDAFTHGDFNTFADLCSPNYVEYEMDTLKSKLRGLDATKESFMVFHRAFPNLGITYHSVAVAGDTVFVYRTIKGVMTDSLMNIPPLNKEISLSGIDMFLIDNNKITAHWGFSNMSDMDQFAPPKKMTKKDKMKNKM